MNLQFRIILSAILIVGFISFHFIQKYIMKKHREDPTFVEEQRRREEAYRKKIEEENDMLSAQINSEIDSFDEEE